MLLHFNSSLCLITVYKFMEFVENLNLARKILEKCLKRVLISIRANNLLDLINRGNFDLQI